MSNENRSKALATALSAIEKQFGKGAVMRMGDESSSHTEYLDRFSRPGYRTWNWRAS